MALNLVYHSLYSDDYLWYLIFRGRQKGTITYPKRKPLPHFSHGWSNRFTMSLVCNYSRKLFLKINCTICFVFNRSALKMSIFFKIFFKLSIFFKIFSTKFVFDHLRLLLEKISSYFIWISAEKTRLGPFNSIVLKKKKCNFLIKF